MALFKDGEDWRRQLADIAKNRHLLQPKARLLVYTIKHYEKCKDERLADGSYKIPRASEFNPKIGQGTWYIVRADYRKDVVNMERNVSNSAPSRRTFVDSDYKNYKPSKWVEKKGDVDPILIYSYYDLFDGTMKKRIATVPGSGVWYIGYANAEKNKKNGAPRKEKKEEDEEEVPDLELIGNQSPGAKSTISSLDDLFVEEVSSSSSSSSRRGKRIKRPSHQISDEEHGEYKWDEALYTDDDSEDEKEEHSPKRQRTESRTPPPKSLSEEISFLVEGRKVSVHPSLMRRFAQIGALPSSLLDYLK
jgi:hypothetical protein